jgi:Spy/CpxP family protein refolding chaperone
MSRTTAAVLAAALLPAAAAVAAAVAAWSTARLAAARNRRVLVLVSGTLQDGFGLRGNLAAAYTRPLFQLNLSRF